MPSCVAATVPLFPSSFAEALAATGGGDLDLLSNPSVLASLIAGAGLAGGGGAGGGSTDSDADDSLVTREGSPQWISR